MIKLPYKGMPRRLWDLKSNRVVEFRMLQSELLAYKSTTAQRFGIARAKFQASHSSEIPVFWAISHSWESRMDSVKTPINQFQWEVPLPYGLDLENDVRQELLSYGIEYVWLDVLCLRQNIISGPEMLLGETKNQEWKLDVPTIGNIYRVAKGIVRYFNGLGRPFSSEGWDGDRHWLQRAWTLQEIKTENSTINGGIQRGPTRSTASCLPVVESTPNIMNTYGTMAGQDMTLRSAIQPVLKLAADVDSSTGCSLYALVREMSRRKATKSTDKVAGLVYLLRLTQLPTYNETAKDNDVWARCFHMLPLARKIELLFDFPHRSEQQPQWFPTWSELMTWPAVHAGCDYSPATRTEGHRYLEMQDLADITESEEAATEGSLFISDIWALSHCSVTLSSTQPNPSLPFINQKPSTGVDYNVTVRLKNINKVYGFYSAYDSQKPIENTSLAGQQYEFTIARADLGHSNNWVVCKFVKRLKAKCNSTSSSCELGQEQETCESGEMLEKSIELEIEVLRKVGVLRTDFSGEMWVGVDVQGDNCALRRIHALFI